MHNIGTWTVEQERLRKEQEREHTERGKVAALQGSWGFNAVRKAICEHIISQLDIPDFVRSALQTAMGPRSIIYDDNAFIAICNAWVEQHGYQSGTDRAQIATLAKSLLPILRERGFKDEQVAVSLFPAFEYFMTEAECPALSKCAVW